MSIIKHIEGLPKPAKIALAIGGALAIGYALWRMAEMLGIGPAATPTPTTPAPVETTPTTTTPRVPVGTDSTGAPILGTGIQAIDKSASSVAHRALSTARKLTAA